jgi:hypothetical protein
MHAHEEREWKTRKTRIDSRLQAQGWEIVPFDASRPLGTYKRHAIEEYPSRPAHHVLVSNGRILAGYSLDTTKRYPTHGSVKIYVGLDGSGSIFFRS